MAKQKKVRSTEQTSIEDPRQFILYCGNCPHYDYEGEDDVGVSKCQQAERYVSRWDTCYLKKKI